MLKSFETAKDAAHKKTKSYQNTHLRGFSNIDNKFHNNQKQSKVMIEEDFFEFEDSNNE